MYDRPVADARALSARVRARMAIDERDAPRAHAELRRACEALALAGEPLTGRDLQRLCSDARHRARVIGALPLGRERAGLDGWDAMGDAQRFEVVGPIQRALWRWSQEPPALRSPIGRAGLNERLHAPRSSA